MLHCASDNLFFSCDQVLTKISPNISVQAMEPEANPLGEYLHSLDTIRQSIPEAALVLPGHHIPFTGLHTRIAELAEHHATRCGQIAEAATARPITAAEAMPCCSNARWTLTKPGSRSANVLVINVNETANASGTATTDLSRSSSGDVGMPNPPRLHAGAPQGLSHTSTRPTWCSSPTRPPSTAPATPPRNGSLSGNIAVRVVKEMPNGDLYLEGTKVILINNEEYHLYVSGLVRPTDIAQDNSIVSTRIADAQIEFTGRGDIADQQNARLVRQGARRRQPVLIRRPTMKLFARLAAMIAVLSILCSARPARADKLRELADVGGARENQLVGYGIVSGLTGTGDDISVPFAAQSTLSLLRRLGVQIDQTQLAQMRLRNVAAVAVTATLPAFAKAGTQDRHHRRLHRQRQVAERRRPHPDGAEGRRPARLRRRPGCAPHRRLLGPRRQRQLGELRFDHVGSHQRRRPRRARGRDHAGDQRRAEARAPHSRPSPWAARIAEAVNAKLGANTAFARDGGLVSVKVPGQFTDRTVELVAVLEDLEVTPIRRARVVINERTGTIVAGGDVRLAPVAVMHGNLTIVVKETPVASQPGAFSKGTTKILPPHRDRDQRGQP